jgi:hypothetical protein
MSAHRARARWLLIAFVVAGVCMASLTAYAQTYSVSGTVTLTASQTPPKNRPNACVTVILTRFSGNTGLTNNTINTDAAGNGTYSFTGLPAGDFTVSAYAYELTAPATCTLFPTTTTSRVYTLKYYDGTADSRAGMSDAGAADYFTLGAAHQIQTVNFNLVDTTNGSISGTVTEVGGGTISGATVSVHVHPRANAVQSVTTNASGVFTIPGLPPGRYGIGAHASGHAVKYYVSARGRATYTPITVTAGITATGKNIALDTANGSISGFVRDGSNAAVTNVCIAAMDKTSGGFVRSACPDLSTGAYTINRLAPGTYRLRAFHAETGFVNQYYGGGTAEADFEGGADVVIPPAGGTISNQNITMVANAGQIRGNVRVADVGAPIAGASISVRTPNGNYSAGGDSTHADGSFLVRGLAPGVYRVRVTHPEYGTLWFTFAGGTLGSEDAALVSVVANNDTTGINVDLDPNPGSITGKVTTDGTTPLVGYSVSVAPTSGLRTNVTGATVQEDGTYEVLGLDPGTYIVRTNMQYNDQAPTNPPGHAVLYYNNKASRETADVVTVAAGTVTPNIDLIPSPTFGSLSGRVTKIDGTTGLALAGLLAFDAATGNRVWSSETDSTGAFTISQLPPGNYKVRATLQRYGSRFFLAGTPGTPDLDLATSIPVSAAANFSNVNIKLEVAIAKVGVFRPSDGYFYLDYNGNGQWEGCGIDRCLGMGLSGDVPLIGDWDGTGIDKVGFFRPSDGTFYLDFDGNGKWGGCGAGQPDRCLPIGLSSDIPLVGDWSGSGKAKVGVFRSSDGMFYLDVGRIGFWDGCDSDKCVPIGLNGDKPFVGDWNGTGSSKVGTFRPNDGTFYLDYNGSGTWDGCGIDRCLRIGLSGDVPLVGDWNGSGTAKVGTFRPSDGYFYLDYNGNGQWDGCGIDRCLQIGMNGDIPLVGDWNGTGTDKVGTFRPSSGTFYLDYNGSGTWDGCGVDRCLQIGMNGDIPFVGKW